MKKNLSVQPNTSLKNKTGSWRTYRPVVDINKCIGCFLCAKLCPEQAIAMVKVDKIKAKINAPTVGALKSKINYDYCKGCGLCASECPVAVITMAKEEK